MTQFPNRRRSTLLRAVPFLIVLLLAIPAAVAQVPETFDNLQVLPEDLPRQELIETMRGFSFALGVRCHHCHVGREGQPMSEWDFASDDKAPKRVARVMMRMTREINDHLLPRVDTVEGRPAHTLTVSCVTCHHGLARPEVLEDVLERKIAREGVAAAVAYYRQVREATHGRGRFDFGEWTLLRLTERLARADNTEATVAFLRLNAEMFPGSSPTRLMLGRALINQGDREGGRRELETARDLGNPRAAEFLETLKNAEPAQGVAKGGGGS